nr:hypothetical protein GCM10025730_15140 [Promicromonospora thailandica]
MGADAQAGGDVGDGLVVHVAVEQELAVLVGQVGQGGAQHGDVGLAFGVQLGAVGRWGQVLEGVVLDGVVRPASRVMEMASLTAARRQ